MFSSWIHCFVILPRTANWPVSIIYICCFIPYTYLLHDSYATESSILLFTLSPPLHTVSAAFTRLSYLHTGFCLSLFSTLFSYLSLSLLSMFTFFTARFPPCLVGGHFSLLDRNSATLCIRYTLARTKSIGKHWCTYIYLGFVYN